MLRLIALFIFVLFLSSCSVSKSSLINSHKKYIQPVSSNNPYNSSNLLISNMMKDSDDFQNFIKFSGAPKAILITKKVFNSPREIALYYPNNQYYVANKTHITTKDFKWEVVGPFETDWRISRNIPKENTAVVLNVNGNNYKFNKTVNDVNYENKRRLLLPVIPPEPKIIIKEVEVPVQITETEQIVMKKKKSDDPLDQFMIEEGTPINTDLQALLQSKGYASRDNNRDILHTVKSEKEKFIAIVNWYTKSTDNTPAVQIANPEIEDIHNMSVKTKIRIPYKLIKEFKRMPLEAVFKK